MISYLMTKLPQYIQKLWL